MNAIDRLEKARELIESGELRGALAALPPRTSLPAALRAERDLAEADALRGQGFFSRSEKAYRRVLSAARGDAALWLEAALGSAAGLRAVGRPAGAERLLDAAARLARREKASWALSRIRLERALVARARGRWSVALPELRAMAAKAIRESEWSEASFLLWAIAGALRFSGDLEGSRSAFERSLTLARRSRDLSAEGYAVLGLGGVTRIQGDLARSGRYYAQAMKSFARTDDRFAQAYAHCGLANSLRQRGLRVEAERHYRSAYRLYASLGDRVDLAFVDWGLGKLRLDSGRAAEAIAYFRRAIPAFASGEELRGECLAELTLAQALHSVGRTREAEPLFDRAVRRGRAGRLHAHLELYT